MDIRYTHTFVMMIIILLYLNKYTEIVGACMDKNATVMILENISAIHSPIFVFSL